MYNEKIAHLHVDIGNEFFHFLTNLIDYVVSPTLHVSQEGEQVVQVDRVVRFVQSRIELLGQGHNLLFVLFHATREWYGRQLDQQNTNNNHYR